MEGKVCKMTKHLSEILINKMCLLNLITNLEALRDVSMR